ncbi:hypothetical protein QZH41_005482, partial [Actinostola sp. cb2023]
MGYSANILAECLDDEDDCGERTRQRWSYQDIGMECWAPVRHITWTFLCITLFTSIS